MKFIKGIQIIHGYDSNFHIKIGNASILLNLLVEYNLLPILANRSIMVNVILKSESKNVIVKETVLNFIDIEIPFNPDKFLSMNWEDQKMMMYQILYNAIKQLSICKLVNFDFESVKEKLKTISDQKFIINRYQFKNWKLSPKRSSGANVHIFFDGIKSCSTLVVRDRKKNIIFKSVIHQGGWRHVINANSNPYIDWANESEVFVSFGDMTKLHHFDITQSKKIMVHDVK